MTSHIFFSHYFAKNQSWFLWFFAYRKKILNLRNVILLISKLIEKKNNSKCLIGYLDKAIRPLVLIMPQISGYVKTFKVEDENSKLMSFGTDDETILEKYYYIEKLYRKYRKTSSSDLEWRLKILN